MTVTSRPADSQTNRRIAEEPLEKNLLEWRIHLLSRQPEKLTLVVLGYIAALLLWWLVFPHIVTLFLPTVALTVALSEYLFPIRYRLTNKGAHADCGISRLFIAWEDVHRITTGSDGVFLSHFRRASRLDAFRGVRMRFADGNDETVRELVKQQRDAMSDSKIKKETGR